MSAFILSHAHVCYLATAWGQCERNPGQKPETLAQMLLNDNAASLAALYAERHGIAADAEENARELAYQPWPGNIDPAQLWKAIRCADYQNCEHEAWKESPARLALETMGEDIAGEDRERAERDPDIMWHIEFFPDWSGEKELAADSPEGAALLAKVQAITNSALASAANDDGDKPTPPATPARGIGGSLPQVFPAGNESDPDTVPMGATVLVTIPGAEGAHRAMVVNRMRRAGVFNLRMPDGALALAFAVTMPRAA